MSEHDQPTQATQPTRPTQPTRSSPVISIANEFAEVFVQRVETRNGVRLQIHSPRMGTAIRLDALELESLTFQDTEVFSKFLENPYGSP